VTFKDWATSKKLTEHTTSFEEISALLNLADTRIKDCKLMLGAGISTNTFYANVYESTLPCAKAVLAASGYRIGKDAEGGHHLLFQALTFTIDKGDRYVTKLQAARKQRQQITYESVADFTPDKANEFFEIVLKMRKEVEDWIKNNHPHLLIPPKPKSAKPAAEPHGNTK
jgi:hypothetical protein